MTRPAALEAILSRRSIRRYTDEPVPEEAVTELLRAAMAAPSARNQRPWHFVVVRDPQVREALAAAQPNAAPWSGRLLWPWWSVVTSA